MNKYFFKKTLIFTIFGAIILFGITSKASASNIYWYSTSSTAWASSTNGWTQLSNCSINTSAYTVTCTTDHFSVFSLFGVKPITSTGHSGGSSGGGGMVHLHLSLLQPKVSFLLQKLLLSEQSLQSKLLL